MIQSVNLYSAISSNDYATVHSDLSWIKKWNILFWVVCSPLVNYTWSMNQALVQSNFTYNSKWHFSAVRNCSSCRYMSCSHMTEKYNINSWQLPTPLNPSHPVLLLSSDTSLHFQALTKHTNLNTNCARCLRYVGLKKFRKTVSMGIRVLRLTLHSCLKGYG